MENDGKVISGVEVTDGTSLEGVVREVGSIEDVSIGTGGRGIDQDRTGELVFTAEDVKFAVGDENTDVSTGLLVTSELSGVGVDVATVSMVTLGDRVGDRVEDGDSVFPRREERLAWTDVFPTSVFVVKSVVLSESVPDSGGLSIMLAWCFKNSKQDKPLALCLFAEWQQWRNSNCDERSHGKL